MLDICDHRILPQQVDRTLGECASIPFELIGDIVRMPDSTKQVREGIMEAKRLLRPLAEGIPRKEEGLQEGVMDGDRIVGGMRMEYDDVLVLECFGVGGGMDGCLVV